MKTIFRSIMQGEQSGVETSALNTWFDNMPSFPHILQYVQTLSHPIFKYNILCFINPSFILFLHWNNDVNITLNTNNVVEDG